MVSGRQTERPSQRSMNYTECNGARRTDGTSVTAFHELSRMQQCQRKISGAPDQGGMHRGRINRSIVLLSIIICTRIINLWSGLYLSHFLLRARRNVQNAAANVTATVLSAAVFQFLCKNRIFAQWTYLDRTNLTLYQIGSYPFLLFFLINGISLRTYKLVYWVYFCTCLLVLFST